MTKYKMTIAYDGTAYHGWQIQPDQATIQGVLEEVLFKITAHHIRIFGAGRTDAGVHAEGQVAHFETEQLMLTSQWRLAFNSRLPSDIRVQKVQEASDHFHARKSAISKIYRYSISFADVPSVFDRNRKLHIAHDLNIAKMRSAARHFIGKKDMSNFGVNPRRKDGKQDNPLKVIKKIRFAKKGDDLFIDIQASGFLYKMARRMVGTLMEVGRGKTHENAICELTRVGVQMQAGPTVLPHGLCLVKVMY
ncbi:MAG: tRNA pseudouridine(38-40) synthase TruA [Chlamydiota bacterium]|nr:tRNA pseudouridine(38-40) synthase TruA [Chlamydiota bacterium]